MNNQFSKTLLATAFTLTLGLGSSAFAAYQGTVALAPGGEVLYDSGPTSGGETGSHLVTSTEAITGVDGYVGTLSSYVLSGTSGLTFVYEVTNDSAVSANLGITEMLLQGFAGVDIKVAMGTNLFSTPTGSEGPYLLINPDTLDRSDSSDLGDSLYYYFTPGVTHGPPIFSDQSSFQMIVYTNASQYTVGTGLLAVDLFDANGNEVTEAGVSDALDIYTPIAPVSSVPESGTTAMLVGLALIPLGLAKKRS
jgi:hypothetical protein